MFVLCFITCLIHALCLWLYSERCVGERSIVDNSKWKVYHGISTTTCRGHCVRWREPIYNKHFVIYVYFYFFLHSLFMDLPQNLSVHLLTQLYMCTLVVNSTYSLFIAASFPSCTFKAYYPTSSVNWSIISEENMPCSLLLYNYLFWMRRLSKILSQQSFLLSSSSYCVASSRLYTFNSHFVLVCAATQCL